MFQGNEYGKNFLEASQEVTLKEGAMTTIVSDEVPQCTRQMSRRHDLTNMDTRSICAGNIYMG